MDEDLDALAQEVVREWYRDQGMDDFACRMSHEEGMKKLNNFPNKLGVEGAVSFQNLNCDFATELKKIKRDASAGMTVFRATESYPSGNQVDIDLGKTFAFTNYLQRKFGYKSSTYRQNNGIEYKYNDEDSWSIIFNQ